MNGTENCKFLTRTLLRFDLLHNLVLDTTSFGINNILGWRVPETHWGECVLKWGLQLHRGSRSVLGPRNKCNLNWKNLRERHQGPSHPLLSIFTVWPSTEICPNIRELYFDCKQKIFCYQFSPTSCSCNTPTPLSLSHPTRSCIIAHFNYKSLQVSQIPAEYLTLIALHSAESLFLLCKIIILSNYKTADMGSIFLHKYNRIICRVSCWMCFSCER